MHPLRRDIQFLRGIAVLLVVIYHANLDILSHGYLGVDVFFVISGFLITKIILQGLDSGKFSFSQFYIRRSKRLLPALYCTLFFSFILSAIILTPTDFLSFIKQFISAVTFSSNIVIPEQIGYFQPGSETKPLLHIWSLSLEEQYYFILPFFLFITKNKWRPYALTLVFFISISWCFSWATDSGSPRFLWRFTQASVDNLAFFGFLLERGS